MNNINTQAKNEVRDLLAELVVSPVASDVKSLISGIENSLSNLREEDNKNNQGLKGLITRELNTLSKVLNKFDEVSDNIGGLEQTLKLIKYKTDLLDAISSDVKENYQKISEIINNIESLKELLSAVSGNLASLSKELEDKAEDYNNNLLALTKRFDSINDSLREQNNDNSESYVRIYQQNKRSFYIMLVLSIINTIGLIAIVYILINN